jgi:hypothetical protein
MSAEDSVTHSAEEMILAKENLEYKIDIAVALLNNYACCGRLQKAKQFFERLRQLRGSVSVLLWNIMIKVTNFLHLFFRTFLFIYLFYVLGVWRELVG